MQNGQLTVAEFGDSNQVEVGAVAIAIGNPFGLMYLRAQKKGRPR